KDQTVRVWNVASGAVTQSLTGHPAAVYRVGFNKAGTKLLSCGHSGEVKVWNLADGKPLFDVTAPAVAWSATYAPAGDRVLVTCSNSHAYFVTLPAAAQN
ncbi:MAG: WD40 repeat domain-containing protein, partial [Planctomycetales bacterium]